MNHGRVRAEVLSDSHLGDDSLPRSAGEFDAQKLGEGELCLVHPVEQIQLRLLLACGFSARREAPDVVFWQDGWRDEEGS